MSRPMHARRGAARVAPGAPPSHQGRDIQHRAGPRTILFPGQTP